MRVSEIQLLSIFNGIGLKIHDGGGSVGCDLRDLPIFFVCRSPVVAAEEGEESSREEQ